MRRPGRIVNFFNAGWGTPLYLLCTAWWFFQTPTGFAGKGCLKFQYPPLFDCLIVIFSNFQCHLF